MNPENIRIPYLYSVWTSPVLVHLGHDELWRTSFVHMSFVQAPFTIVGTSIPFLNVPFLEKLETFLSLARLYASNIRCSPANPDLVTNRVHSHRVHFTLCFLWRCW